MPPPRPPVPLRPFLYLPLLCRSPLFPFRRQPRMTVKNTSCPLPPHFILPSPLILSPVAADNPGPGQPKDVTITLLKAEPAKSREMWWRVPLKGLENRAPARRPPQQPADPEMVRGGTWKGCARGRGRGWRGYPLQWRSTVVSAEPFRLHVFLSSR